MATATAYHCRNFSAVRMQIGRDSMIIKFPSFGNEYVLHCIRKCSSSKR